MRAGVSRPASWMAAGVILLGFPGQGFSLTFQFDRSRPGVREFVASYISFRVKGGDVTSVLPPTFYILTSRTEQDLVIAAKVGEISQEKGLVSLLADLAGPQPQKIKGPHGEVVVSNPAAEETGLSAYTLWGSWLFAARTRDGLVALLKRHPNPQAVTTPDKVFVPDGLKGPFGVRFWAENSSGDLTAFLQESQQKVLISMVKDPAQIARLSGMFQIGPGRTLIGHATIIPSAARHQAALRGDLKFILESIRRRLKALGVSYRGRLVESRDGLTLKVTIGDYAKAQPGLIRLQPSSTTM